MAENGSDDAHIHRSLAAQLAHMKRNLDNTMAVVQKHDESIEEMKRDIKVAKSTWMKDRAKKS